VSADERQAGTLIKKRRGRKKVMKKTLVTMTALAFLATLFVGCASVKTANRFNAQKIDVNGSQPVAHINSSNWGLYFLSTPLIAGSTKKVGEIEFMGEDSVQIGPVVDILTAKSKKMGATKTLDLSSDYSSFMIPFPIPFLFYINSVEVSGNAVK